MTAVARTSEQDAARAQAAVAAAAADLRLAARLVQGSVRDCALRIVGHADAVAAHLPSLAPLAPGVAAQMLPRLAQATQIVGHHAALDRAGALDVVPDRGMLTIGPPMPLGAGLAEVLGRLADATGEIARLTAVIRGEEAIAAASRVAGASPAGLTRDDLLAAPAPAPATSPRRAGGPVPVVVVLVVALVLALAVIGLLSLLGDRTAAPSALAPLWSLS